MSIGARKRAAWIIWALGALALQGCGTEREAQEAEARPGVAAVFEPAATPRPEIPLPNLLLLDRSSGLVRMPTGGLSEASRAFADDYLNGLTGFPPASILELKIAAPPAELDLATVAQALTVLEVTDLGTCSGEAPSGPALLVDGVRWEHDAEAQEDGSTWTRFVGRPPSPWGIGRCYAVLVGPEARTAEGERLASSPTFDLVKATKPLVDDDELLLDADGEVMPALAALRREEVERLEWARRRLQLIFDVVAGGIAGGPPLTRGDVSLLWAFPVQAEHVARFDPALPDIPLPNDMLDNDGDGYPDYPVCSEEALDPESDEHDARCRAADPPAQRALFAWLNAVDGFSVTTRLSFGFSAAVDPDTIGEQSVRVYDLGPAADAATPDSWTRFPYRARLSEDGRDLILLPDGDLSRGHPYLQPGHRYLAVVTSDVRAASGGPLVASQVFALLRQRTPVAREGKSLLEALSDQQASGLEALRAGLSPLFDALASRGGDAVERRDVLLMWSWRTTSATEAVFDPDLGAIPFPNDVLARLDGEGRVEGVALPGCDDSLAPSFSGASRICDLNVLDAFSTLGAARVRFTRKLDPASAKLLTSMREGSSGTVDVAAISESGVMVYPIDPVDPASSFVDPDVFGGVDVSVSQSFGELALAPAPGSPFPAARQMLVLVTKRVKAAGSAAPTIPTPMFRLLTTAHPLVAGGESQVPALLDAAAAQRLEALRLRLELVGRFVGSLTLNVFDLSDLAIFWTFTTGDPTREMLDLVVAYRKEALSTELKAGSLEEPDPAHELLEGRDLSGVGKVMLDGRFEHLSLVHQDDVRLSEAGPVELPRFTYDGDGSPSWRSDELHFVLALPEGDPPEGGWPLVIYQHRHGGDRSELFELASLYASKGLASLAVDAHLHGARAPKGADSGALFLSADLFASRDNIRQSALDLVALTRFVRDGLDDALVSKLGLEEGAHAVATDSIYFHGVSAGGVVGSIFVAVEPAIRRAVLSVTGGHLVRIFTDTSEESLKALLAGALESPGAEPGRSEHAHPLDTARWILERADPISYASLISPEPEPGGEARAVLFQLARDDEVIPNALTRALWTSAGGDAHPDRVLLESYDSACHAFLTSDCEGEKDLSAGASAGELDAARVLESQRRAREDLATFLATGAMP